MKATKYAVKSHIGRPRRATPNGFTLLELLVVIALTAILIVLVFRPLIDSFNLTSRAGTQIESQTAAREVLREVATTLSNAESIYDNTRPSSQINIWLYDGAGNPYYTQLQYGLVDYVAPGHQSDLSSSFTGPMDPTTGEPILSPTLPVGQLGYSLPLAPGRVIERMFLALRDNRVGPDKQFKTSGMPLDNFGNYHGYANRWSDPHQKGSPTNDNRYTLFKAQFLVSIPIPGVTNSANQTFIPNLKLFHTGTVATDPTSVTDKMTDQVILNDPNFFYDDGLAGDITSKGDKKWAVPGWQDLVGDGKVYYWENWRAVATSMLELPKADTIALARDQKGNITYDTNNHPTVRALITFAPSFVQNEAANPVAVDSSGSEVSYASSSTFTSLHGAWSTPFRVVVYQNNKQGDPTTTTNADPLSQNPLTIYQYYINPVSMATKIVYQEVATGANPPDPATGTDVGPMIDVNGFFTNMNPQYAFTVDAQRGTINFAFPQWVYFHIGATHYPQEYQSSDVNAGLNAGAAYQRRYLLLDDQGPGPAEQVPAPAVSPLGLLYLNPVQNNPATKPQRLSIVPGSEVVYGPDQRPGAHYGWSIQYTRVSSNAGAVGPNQYKINYQPIPNSTSVSDQNDPRARTGYIEFDSNPDSSAYANLPATDTSTGNLNEDPDGSGLTRPHSLPQVKAGTKGQGSAPGDYLPADPVLVNYSFQMNRPSDIVKIDYLTRELMSVTINSRLYDPATTGAQDTLLTSQVKARNLQR